MAGAPRTRNCLIASQTAPTSRHSISTNSVGNRVWSINLSKPVNASPTHRTVWNESDALLMRIGLMRQSLVVLVHPVIFVLFGLLGINPRVELGEDFPDVAQRAF